MTNYLCVKFIDDLNFLINVLQLKNPHVLTMNPCLKLFLNQLGSKGYYKTTWRLSYLP